MTDPEHCVQCGFEWLKIGFTEAASRLDAVTEAWVGVLRLADAMLDERPSPTRWSVLECASHVRDVLLSVRERIITTAILDDFTGVALHRDERVVLGFYRLDSREELIAEIPTAARLLAKTWTSLPSPYEDRRYVFRVKHLAGEHLVGRRPSVA